MKIGICAPYDLAIAGGVNTHIRAQAAALRRLGHDVCVFGAASGPLPDGEVSLGGCVSMVVGDTETGFGIDPRSWWTARRLLRERRFDLLHVHEPLMPLPPWFVMAQADVPVVATFHTYRSQGHRWYPKYRWIFDPLMARVSVRLAVSEAAKRTVAEHFPGDYEIVPNMINVAHFSTPAPRPAVMPADVKHVLYVGRIEPRKGVDLLVQAMTPVQSRLRVPVQLVIVGDGPGRAAIERSARERGVRLALAGRVSDAELPAYYQAADVVCSPALADESFGLVLLEAMAAGRPVLASRIGGYSELVQSTGGGLLATTGDLEDLVLNLSVMLKTPDLLKAMGARGAESARQYDENVVAKRLEGIYELCLHELPVEGRRPQQLVVRS